MSGSNSASLLTLSAADIAAIDISPADVLQAVTGAYRGLAEGRSTNPGKLSVASQGRSSVAYSMLARDGASEVVAFKTSYKSDPHHDKTRKKYYTTITLYDDTTGLPIALMDCARIGALRTPAVSALLAAECASPTATRVLLIGTGTQGIMALPLLLAACPRLTDLQVFGTHPDGIRSVVEQLHRDCPGRSVTVVDDVESAARGADIILAVAGDSTPARVLAQWVRPGALSILVGYGLDPSTLHDADYVVATSSEQMQTTGTDMAFSDGTIRPVHAELPDIVAGRAAPRRTPTDRVFAYNSGLVVTDIALGLVFAQAAIAQGRGRTVELWS